jgi:hypothetical protein
MYKQEQQRIAEESREAGSGNVREPKNRGEVYKKEEQKIAGESDQP